MRAGNQGSNTDALREPETAGIAQANRTAATTAPASIEAAPPGNPSERAVLAALGYGPVTYEWLAEHSGLSDDVLHGALLALELAGRVASVAGGRFARLDAAPTPSTRGVLHSPA